MRLKYTASDRTLPYGRGSDRSRTHQQWRAK
jgi:hypothetical protein